MHINDPFNAVMAIDLDPIKTKLMHVASGEGWSLDKANAVEKEYRRFLCLMKLYPEEDTAPLVDVDTFWHYHILDTMKYAADCDRAFGYFLHHYPYVGLRGGDDEQFRVDSGERMRNLYETTFGEAYPGTPEDCMLPVMADLTAGRPGAAITAWCAGPAAAAGLSATGAVTAWCAGPAAATAWCAGPAAAMAVKPGAKAVTAATAWCAGPAAKRPAGATAWCAGPAAALAAMPGARTAGDATAWCAGPAAGMSGKLAPKAAASGTAWCAGPAVRASASPATGPRLAA